MIPKFKRASLELKRVVLEFKHPILLGVGGLLVFVVLAEWLLWFMPKPHGRLHYMVAGTAATGVALGAVFARVAIRRAIWAAHRRQ